MNNRMIDPEKKGAGQVFKELALNFCIGFTIIMLFSMVFGLVFADEQAKEGILYCVMLAGAMLAAVILQMLFFTPVVFKRMKGSTRLVGFGVCLYVLLAGMGAYFQWFPADNAWAWVSFTIIYLVILALMTVVFTCIYRKDERALNEGLKRFKSREK